MYMYISAQIEFRYTNVYSINKYVFIKSFCLEIVLK